MERSITVNRPGALRGSVVDALRSGDYSRENLRKALLLRGEEQEELRALARERRAVGFPDNQAEVRSVIEISNICRQRCNYCTMASGTPIARYVISKEEVYQVVHFLYGEGRRVFLLQSGENPSERFCGYIAECVNEIKWRYADIEVILCLGNLSWAQYDLLRKAGSDRYILKFETANPRLYSLWKPSDTLERRLQCLEMLCELGFKVGSGNMVGLPGQTLDDIVDDLLLLGRYWLAMMSCTVFIPGTTCAYNSHPMGDVQTTLNLIALMRILYPNRLMPTTSCLEQATPGGLFLGLMSGANTVTIHDGTPPHQAALFPIYSAKRVTPNKEFVAGVISSANLTSAPGPIL